MADDGRSAKTVFADEMREAILTLDLPPGTDLDEVALGERHGLSRTPLREVIRQLAGEGYLTLQPHRGARVSDMSSVTLRDFFLAAPMVYAAILRLAAQHATAGQIEALKEAQAAFARALDGGTVRARTLANNRFHAITGEMAANRYLLPSFHRLLIDHARIGMTFYRPRGAGQPERMAEASRQHEAIIAAIEAGDDAEAARLAAEHWTLSRDQIESFVLPEGLSGDLGGDPGGAPDGSARVAAGGAP
ncbi:MAG: FCD domain-containing protein [Deinococcus-Thermus bacterium]|jgi:DNA-binding GntR family transcriptional regulator|nr:FCD domain-containing protein [Deinococcota bacterium]